MTAPLKPANRIGPWPLGINNRTEAHQLPGGALRDAVNVDITKTGKPRRRKGSAQVVAAPGGKLMSMWSPVDQSIALVADTGTLYRFNGTALIPIATGLAHHKVCYLQVPGRGIAYSDGVAMRRIDPEDMPFAMASPSLAASFATDGTGALDAGVYKFALTWGAASGEESGLSPIAALEVIRGSRITLTLPINPPDGAVALNVYGTTANGEVLGLIEQVATDLGTLEIATAPPASGVEPTTRFTIPLPGGDMLAYLNARVYSVKGKLVRYTLPFSGQHDPRTTMLFPEDVSIIFGTPSGLWIVSDQTYFLSGDPTAEGSLRARAQVRAVPGTLVETPTGKGAMWFSERGLVTTGEEGAISFAMDDNVAVLPAQEGSALYREEDGLQQAIFTTKGAGVSTARASTWFAATLSAGETRDALAT